MKYFYLLSLFIYLLYGCKTSKSQGIYSVGDCPFKSLDWMEVRDSLDKSTSFHVYAALSNSATAMSNILKQGDTSNLGLIKAEIEKAKKSTSSKKAIVTQEFYQYYVGRSIELCGVYEYIAKNNFSDSAQKRRMQNHLEDMIIEFDKKTFFNSKPTSYYFNNNADGTQINRITVNDNEDDINSLRSRADSLENILLEDKKEKEAYALLKRTPPDIGSEVFLIDSTLYFLIIVKNKVPIKFEYSFSGLKSIKSYILLNRRPIEFFPQPNMPGAYYKIGHLNQYVRPDSGYSVITNKITYSSYYQVESGDPKLSGQIIQNYRLDFDKQTLTFLN